MYRIYIRTHKQAVYYKTTTTSPDVAEAAFRELMHKREFWATKASAVLSLDGRQLEVRRFDRIIPVEDHWAQKLHDGEPIPPWPRYIYPLDVDLPKVEPHIMCYVKQRTDTPFFESDEPVRLFHDQ